MIIRRDRPRRREPKVLLMSCLEKPPPPAPTAGKMAGYSFASMSGMLDLSSDENAKHFLPRWLRDARGRKHRRTRAHARGMFRTYADGY